MDGTLTLSTAGLSAKDHTVLKSLFSLMERELEQPWQLTPEAHGDMFLVDVDSADGRSLWGQLNLEKGSQCAALTRDRDFNAPFLLHKPLRTRELLRLLNEYSTAAHGEAEQGMWRTLVLSHKPEHYTLAEHLRRRSWSGPVMLRRIGAKDLVIDPGSGSWYANAELDDLLPHLTTELGAQEAYPLGQRDLLHYSNKLSRQSLIDLQWYAGLSVGGGQLHPDIQTDDRIGMMRVAPQVKANPVHQQLAQILIEQPCTPDELAQRSGAPVDDIARFLNACLFCGWLIVDTSGRSQPTPVKPFVAAQPQSSTTGQKRTQVQNSYETV
ncbi:MAG: hypothetical protein Tsb002_24420 [Wenzhouxiangellaceae bacterium]